MTDGIKLEVPAHVDDSSVVHADVGQDVIVTTSDRLELKVRDHMATLKRKHEWQAPMAVFASLLLGLVTSDFKEVLGFSADFWHALFALGTFGAFCWLGAAGRLAWESRNDGTVDDFLQAFKKTEP